MQEQPDKKKLSDIFDDDPFGLLNVKPVNPIRTADDRLIASFEEINSFFEANNKEPGQSGGIQEHQLYARLKGIRENQEKVSMLHQYDRFGLLNYHAKEIHSIDDILNDDTFGFLDDTTGLYDLKNVKAAHDRQSTDFVARRKPCRDFDKYEDMFKAVQKDLSSNKRRLIPFKQEDLKQGEFYVHNGVLLFIEHIDFIEEKQEFKSGSRVRKDGRTRIIFENGTESNMLYRSIYKQLLANGKSITENIDHAAEELIENFSQVNEDDVEAGYIYVLRSKSTKEEIRSIQNLYKIGYSKTTVEDRIKNASCDPTYLMADVKIVTAFKCYNLNPQKFEQLVHNFFGAACLDVDVFDSAGKRCVPREWFIVPLPVIEQALELIVNGEIVKYRYDLLNEKIIER